MKKSLAIGLLLMLGFAKSAGEDYVRMNELEIEQWKGAKKAKAGSD